MTYKSTNADIERLIRSGRLLEFEPILGPGEVYRRRLFLHPDITNWLSKIEKNTINSDYADRVKAMLKAFVTGEDFDDDAVCKLMKPYASGIYEIRITFAPQHRIFGGFLRVGEFMALAHDTREKLGKGHGFAPAINRAETLWRSMFRRPPLSDLRSRLLEDFCNED